MTDRNFKKWIVYLIIGGIFGILFTIIAPVDNVRAVFTYDRQAAVNYAMYFCDKVSSDGWYMIGKWEKDQQGESKQVKGKAESFSPGTSVDDVQNYLDSLAPEDWRGVDCAHFVSCCIGNPPSYLDYSGGGLEIKEHDYSPLVYGYVSSTRLVDWLLSNGYGIEVSSLTELEEGDVIAYDWDKNGRPNHVALYLGNGKVAAHSYSACGKDWHLGHSDFDYRFIHIKTGERLLAPSNLKAWPISSSQISLTWQDNANNEEGFEIERRIQGGNYSKVAEVSANTQSYFDSNLSSGTTYCYRVRAYNSVGESSPSNEACATTEVPPVKENPPRAEFAFFPLEPKVNEVVYFGNQSTDPDGDIVSWFWEFGDGSTSTDWNPSHSYSQAGTYTVRLSIRDSGGRSDTIGKSITVREAVLPPPPNQPPIAQFTFTPANPIVGQSVFFDASSSFDPDPGDYITQYRWDFDNDGHFEADTQTVHHAFSFPGSYTVVLLVIDSRGNSSSQHQIISVSSAPPLNGNIQVNATLNGMPWEGVISYFRLIGPQNWDLGGAMMVPTEFRDLPPGTWTFEFQSGGPSGATLANISPSSTQTLPAGGTITFTLNFVITPPPPSGGNPPRASFTFSPPEPKVNEPIFFTDQSTDPDNDIVAWSWDFGDGTKSSDKNPSHSYSQSGNYTVTLLVTDSKGNRNTTNRTLTVKRAEPPPPSAQYLLTLDIQPYGAGFLAMDGIRIESYPFFIWLGRGTRVNLEVFSAAPGYEFNNWEGTVIFDPANPTKVTVQMDGDRTIVAHFREIGAPIPSPTQHQLCIHSEIGALITIDPFPIDGKVSIFTPDRSFAAVLPGWCGNYLEGTLVTLVALPNLDVEGKEYIFQKWTSPNLAPYQWDQPFIQITIGDSNIDLFVVYQTGEISLPTDSDSDGVPDNADSCPSEPGPSWNNGCPEGTPLPPPPPLPPSPPGGKSIEEAIDTNGNYLIDDPEILKAVEYWVQGIPVPGTNGQLIDDQKMLELIEIWISARPLSPSLAGKELKGERLSLQGVKSSPNPVRGSSVRFQTEGKGIVETRVEVFNLSGHLVYDSGFRSGNSLQWNLLNHTGQALANGVYLYVVTVRGFDGATSRSQIKKLVVLR